ncbi:hypothetical protein IKE_05963 [Bacillus cereus VD196]|uniref:ADP ribosyltransferase domain-containing protein n=1 Tax=Bacillus cereus VD196 TaxID=1053243 RepID=A0A9W5PYA4_BACCE|nr:ADP-ribosyltransferase [Bacillus cereus]EJR90576.1 hypothetical protein IKG_05936 [Bacillus cereus VD200]EOO60516.1 hypothetical protein IKE_05963 [Bacillus cereus VD196]
MNFKKGILVSLLSSVTFIMPITHEANVISVATVYANSVDLDFTDNKEAARKWGEKEYGDWKKNKLTAEERTAMENYTGSGYAAINEYLGKTNGELIEKQEELPEGYQLSDAKKLNKKIMKLDSALDKARLTETIMVYRRVSEQQFSMEASKLRPAGSTRIDPEKAENLSLEFTGKSFDQYNFMSTSIAKDPHKSYGPQRYAILMKIKLPKGTHAAYVADISKYPDQLELLVKRGYTFKYDKFSIINDHGWESLQVDVSLIKK